MTRRKLAWVLIGALALTPMLAACGDGEEAPATTTATASATSAASASAASGTPTATPLATPQAAPPRTGVIDVGVTPATLTIFAIDEGDLRSARPAVTVGDFDGDGIGDLLLGAPFGDGPDGETQDAGEAYVIFGARDLGGAIDLAQGEQDVTIFGAKPGDNLGYAVGAADVNDDALDDIIVAAPRSEGSIATQRTDRGEVYVIFGRPNLATTIDIEGGQPDLTVVGAEGFSLLGDSIATGDVNGNGIEDMVLGAPLAGRVVGTPPGGPRTELGEVYVVLGSRTLSGSVAIAEHEQDFKISGPGQFSELGDAVAVGDINNDGTDDIVAVAEAGDPPGGTRSNAGEAFVVFGSASLTGITDTAQAQQDISIYGASADDALGFCASSGDINDDGVDDIVLVAQRADAPSGDKEKCGVAYAIFGSPGPESTIDMLKGEQDLTVVGADAHDLLSSCSAGHDVNGDGIDDLIVGTGSASSVADVRNDTGRVYLKFGSAGLGGLLDLAAGSHDLILLGAEAGDRLGDGVAAGDVNGDGIDELIVVASGADGPDNTRPDAGEIYVFTVAAAAR